MTAALPVRIGSLFSGYGGLDMAAEAYYGGTTAWVSDIDKGACRILAHRYPDVPNLGDLTTVDWTAVEPVDVLTGGFPCQDVSHAGKRAGMRPDTRSGLWTHMAYAVSILRPRYVVAENVRGLLSARAASDVEPCPWCLGGAADGEPDLRALGAVLGDLAELGYDARWYGLRAADVGAPHGRFRVFVVATDTNNSRGDGSGLHRQGERRRPEPQDRDLHAPDTDEQGRKGRQPASGRDLPARGATADPQGIGWDEGRPEPARVVGRFDAALSGARAAADANLNERSRERGQWAGGAAAARGGAADPDSAFERRRAARGYDGVRAAGLEPSGVQWGAYEPAVRRWESVLGRVAPAPTETSPRGAQRLNPAFVEWMMGLPAGHVTEVPKLTRNEQLKALGNGVVPQQAYAALQLIGGAL